MRIAVVGGGIAGLGAAWALQSRHQVTLYEAADWLGGHAHTVDVDTPDGTVAVDTGFLVYNERTYPHLTQLFELLEVATKPSEMSFSFALDDRLEYAGSGLGLFAQTRNLGRRQHWQMARDILRFRRVGPDMLAVADNRPLGVVLDRFGFSSGFQNDYLLPMGAAIWSARIRDIRQFPATTFLQFFANHGLISITGRPQWRTVDGGSRRYVDKLVAPFRDRIRLGQAVAGVHRHFDGVMVRTEGGQAEEYDQIVFATHSDQTLAVLGSTATPMERKTLGSLPYEPNRAILHRDPSLMPKRRRVWSSWNYATSTTGRDHRKASVTYWLNRLQSLPTTEQLFVTLNPLREPQAHLVVDEYLYAHPQFPIDAEATQRQINLMQGANNTWFAGAYLGYGFHEDGLQSGLNVAAALGAPAPWFGSVTPVSRAPEPLKSVA